MATVATTRRRLTSEPWAWVVGGAATAGLLLARDPNQVGSYGFCPLRAVTGLDCPLCGGLRGTYALMHGDLATALDHNVLLPLLLVAAVALGVAARVRDGWTPSPAVWWTIGGVAAVFFVLRNLPWFPYLASGA
jgi:hypothetical protein